MASEACCAAGQPIPIEYAGKGQVQLLGDLNVYVVGGGDKAVIVIYDIFGFGEPPNNGCVRRVCDHLADAGFLAVMPDFYRGDAWAKEDYPPATPELREKFGTWWGTVATYANVLRDVQEIVVPYLSSRRVTSIGAHGFCWGGLMACTLAQEPSLLRGASAVHGARLTVELAEASTCPMLLQPSGEDPPVDDVIAKLLERGFDKSVTKSYPNMVHGFLAARGDWSIPEQGQAAQEALTEIVNFFQSTL